MGLSERVQSMVASWRLSLIYRGQHLAQIMARVDDPMRADDTLVLIGVTKKTGCEVPLDGQPVEVRFTFDLLKLDRAAAPLEAPRGNDERGRGQGAPAP